MNRLLAIAAGDAGCNTLKRLGQHPQYEFLYINSDTKTSAKVVLANKLCVSKSQLNHPENTLGEATELSKDSIQQAIAEYNIIVVVVGLGSGAGTRILQEVAAEVKRAEKVLSVIAFLPFKFEQARRERALSLINTTDFFNKRATIIDLELILSQTNSSKSLIQGLKQAEELAIEKLQHIAFLTEAVTNTQQTDSNRNETAEFTNSANSKLTVSCQILSLNARSGMDKMSDEENANSKIAPFYEINISAKAKNPFVDFSFNIHLTFSNNNAMQEKQLTLNKLINQQQLLLMHADCFALLDGKITVFNPQLTSLKD